MKRVLVIGGGASGLMAAITAAREGAAVTLLEAMEKPGKKILITGNGRCNLTNLDFKREDIYRSEHPDQTWMVLEQFDHESTTSFFHNIGLLTHVRNQGVYPLTDQAASVVDLLIAEARRCKVKIKCNEKIVRIQNDQDIWKVSTATWTYEGDCVILACGSKAYPQTGSDGSGYELAGQVKCQIIEPLPALVPLLIAENLPAKVSGVRSSAQVTLNICDKREITETHTESGEVQWTDYGVSGIVIFQLSRYAVKALKKGLKAILKIDILPDYSEEQLFKFLDREERYGTLGDAIGGILPKKMSSVIIAKAGLKADQKYETVTDKEIHTLIHEMKNITLTVKGSKSFDLSQVCQGGVSLTEVDLSTMESIKNKGLYLTGELLDVDGICGGYNLQWAFSTGYIAGKASANS